MITGLERVAEGRAQIGEKDVTELSAAARTEQPQEASQMRGARLRARHVRRGRRRMHRARN
ncbi:hypothetical protein NK8_57600 (plasmid) [Caballeronia sp. NK8]|nr:hypothetical protein NK8_57600 [Caballeronia sp. NK8]